MKFYTLKFTLVIMSTLSMIWADARARDHQGIVTTEIREGYFPLIEKSSPPTILIGQDEDKAIQIAAANLSDDFKKVCGTPAIISSEANPGQNLILVGSIDGALVKGLVKDGKFDDSDLKGKNEKYIITEIANPMPGIGKALLVAGSDRRGTVYGIYELSEQIGVSPWYDWVDVPVEKQENLSMKPGRYTAGEPAVKYRGIFLNDEAPCLTSWVKNTYGTDYGDHNFYARVFELLLRLRGNFIWPAMWSWAFYADDPLNSKTADDMGIIVGTSHHEPMARNHQEWARHRKENGAWNYTTNQKNIDKFFTEGIRRMKGTEDVVTIGMRGDGDEAMSAEADVRLLEKIIANQRKIIRKETGRKPEKTPQVWALYKEVLDYYDAGLKAPDDVILLLCDDNWGNVRRLPNEKERRHPGGWGMYYHVDYVGAPRNSKWINVTPIQNMWEQLSLTYNYGVDKLWILNVGDLKPMEYPITLFLDMAWNPQCISASDILAHSRDFCEELFGSEYADEAARILNLYCKYAGRVTPEMLDKDTYDVKSGEWEKVTGDFLRLEAEALRLYNRLPGQYHDTYRQIILFPVQAMANLYDMYYSQAMNHYLYNAGAPEANEWAERAETCFNRDRELCRQYNEDIAGGKWNGFMTQKHIGYTIWNDSFPEDTLPELKRWDKTDYLQGGYVFDCDNKNFVAMEAEHFYDAKCGDGMQWTVIPYLGRTRSGVKLMPDTVSPSEAQLTYKMILPEGTTEADVHVIVKSTLDFLNTGGHRILLGFEGEEPVEINLNSELNEKPENIYSVFYPTVARRIVEKTARLKVGETNGKPVALTLSPLDPGIVVEKIVVDCGGYSPSYLFGRESEFTRSEASRQ